MAPKKLENNFLVSTLGKLLVFLVNYAHYTTPFYYEIVKYWVLWEVQNVLWVFPLFLMGKIVVTYNQLELRPALANDLSQGSTVLLFSLALQPSAGYGILVYEVS
jgi:hypothetical protein